MERFTDAGWAAGVAEMTGVLQGMAAARRMVTHGDLARAMHTVRLEAHDEAMNHMLLDVSRNEAEAGRGLLSVIVVHKLGDMEPGKGFFGLAKDMGLDTSDQTKCWINETKKVFAHWSNKKS